MKEINENVMSVMKGKWLLLIGIYLVLLIVNQVVDEILFGVITTESYTKLAIRFAQFILFSFVLTLGMTDNYYSIVNGVKPSLKKLFSGFSNHYLKSIRFTANMFLHMVVRIAPILLLFTFIMGEVTDYKVTSVEKFVVQNGALGFVLFLLVACWVIYVIYYQFAFVYLHQLTRYDDHLSAWQNVKNGIQASSGLRTKLFTAQLYCVWKSMFIHAVITGVWLYFFLTILAGQGELITSIINAMDTPDELGILMLIAFNTPQILLALVSLMIFSLVTMIFSVYWIIKFNLTTASIYKQKIDTENEVALTVT